MTSFNQSCPIKNNQAADESMNEDEIPNKKQKNVVHWFRKGLRLHDQPALLKGLKESVTFRCVYLIDPWFSHSSISGFNKWNFLLQSLKDLDNNLRKLKSRLFVIKGQPADVFPSLFKEWSITHLTFEEDPEPYGKVRDTNIDKMCEDLGVVVITCSSHTLYNLDDIIKKCDGQTPITYKQFLKVLSELDPPPDPEPSLSFATIKDSYTPYCESDDKKYSIPTLEELGFTQSPLLQCIWKGGETEALERLSRYLKLKLWANSYGSSQINLHSLLDFTQTSLSPYLRFGCLSSRLLFKHLTEVYQKWKNENPPMSFYGQLFWREFFYVLAKNNPNFDRMRENPVCVQIPWSTDAIALKKWTEGQTGYPLIDAILTQMKSEGWIHEMAKHAVICFLTFGGLWISWEEGMKIFDEYLIDADYSVNAGTWIWLSASSCFQQIHYYCPVNFGRSIDPNGVYIRKYLPILKNFPNEFIHAPWTASKVFQKQAKCIIGKQYPMPIIDYKQASKLNLERLKQVYRNVSQDLDLKLADQVHTITQKTSQNY